MVPPFGMRQLVCKRFQSLNATCTEQPKRAWNIFSSSYGAHSLKGSLCIIILASNKKSFLSGLASRCLFVRCSSAMVKDYDTWKKMTDLLTKFDIFGTLHVELVHFLLVPFPTLSFLVKRTQANLFSRSSPWKWILRANTQAAHVSTSWTQFHKFT